MLKSVDASVSQLQQSLTTSAQKDRIIPAEREGDSPFLPDTAIQYAWDSTSLGWFKKCPRLYFYQMIEGWRKKETAIDLRFGILYHQALELYDRQKTENVPHKDSLISITAFLLQATWDCDGPWDTGRTDKNRYTLIRSVIWYLDQFGPNDPAETIQLANGKPAVELSFKMELDWGPAEYSGTQELHCQPYLLCGHLDRIVNFLDGTYVMDHKTTKTQPSQYYFDRYDPDNQMTIYTIAAKVIFQTPVRGVIIDAAQIAVGFSRFVRGFTYRTDNQLEEWLIALRSYLVSAERFAVEGYWPMNDTACFTCHFRNICSKDPAVRQNFLESEFTQEDPWNPLKVR
jgi:PD-(D/E)XK nuclease superfamily